MLDTTEQTPRVNLRICGNKSNVATMDAVRRVPTPKETNRWKPIPHASVVDVTRNNLEEAGFEIMRSALLKCVWTAACNLDPRRDRIPWAVFGA